MNNLLYDINDRVPFPKIVAYSFQQLLAIITATVLIANVCGTPISSCLFGACIATILYQILTRFQSPMFISSCGATCGAVISALAISGNTNYFPVVIGGAVIFLIYAFFALLIKLRGVEIINKIFPAVIVGPITMVIGLNLATFIPTYVNLGSDYQTISVLVGIFTMIVVAISSHYFKGFWKTIPFLIGLLAGYLVCIILTICNVAPLVDFTLFKDVQLFKMPEWTFDKWDLHINFSTVIQVVVLFAPVALCSLMEHYSDHKVLSNIIGTDLTKTPGLHRTLLGDGFASLMGTVICGLPNTSYGESIATTGFSKVASTRVITLAALMVGFLSFLHPVQVFILSIPSCVFGGCAMILYGFIAASGLKVLYQSKADLENNKNLLIVAVILTVGVSGIFLFHSSFTGVSLAMVLGVGLNLILRNKN